MRETYSKGFAVRLVPRPCVYWPQSCRIPAACSVPYADHASVARGVADGGGEPLHFALSLGRLCEYLVYIPGPLALSTLLPALPWCLALSLPAPPPSRPLSRPRLPRREVRSEGERVSEEGMKEEGGGRGRGDGGRERLGRSWLPGDSEGAGGDP